MIVIPSNPTSAGQLAVDLDLEWKGVTSRLKEALTLLRARNDGNAVQSFRYAPCTHQQHISMECATCLNGESMTGNTWALFRMQTIGRFLSKQREAARPGGA